MKKSFLGLVFLTFGLLSAEGEILHVYVSPSGNDLNPGTAVQPVASLTGARNVIRALRAQKTVNDTIFVELLPGEYFMDRALLLSPMDAGSKQSPVVFRGQPDARTVLYGGKETDRFEVVHPGLWRVYIPEVARYGLYFEQLYINGERRFRAQTPNRGDFNRVKRIDETILDGEAGQGSFASIKLTLHADDAPIINEIDPVEFDDALVVFYHNWDNTRLRINHVNFRDTAFYMTGKAMYPWNKIDRNSRYVVENYRKALDAPGEWFLQRDGHLYYIPMPGETPDHVRCMYPVNERFITVEGDANKPVEHIRFENLSFQVAAYHTPVRGNGALLQAAVHMDATVMLDDARNVDFINCTFAHTGLHGIWYRKACSDSKVERCHLYDLGGGAVKIGDIAIPQTSEGTPDIARITRNITVHNNILQHGGFVFPSAVGVIIFHASDNQITHNDIANFRYTGISVGWVWGYSYSPTKRNKIEFNHIHYLGWGELCDMGGVYTLGASEGTTVSNNVIHHIYSFNYGGWGLYTDEGAYQILMENNLVYACKNAGFHQHYGKENIIRNNIFAFNLRSQFQLTRVEEHLSLTLTNNIVYYSEGLLYMNNGWAKANVTIDNNCFWDTRTKTPKFHNNMSFSDWQKLGRDKHSIIADPLFVNPQQFDFRFKNTSVAKKIGFKPFDYSKAGVYGSDEWIKKARLSVELEKEYERMVSRYETSTHE